MQSEHSSHHSHPDGGLNCPLCKAISNDSPFILEKRENSTLLLSLEGHPLVVPNNHVRFEDVDQNLAARLGEDIFKYTPWIIDVYEAEGLNIVANYGRAAGQELEHFHFHLIPRNVGDNKVNLNELTRIAERHRREIMLKFKTSP